MALDVCYANFHCQIRNLKKKSAGFENPEFISIDRYSTTRSCLDISFKADNFQTEKSLGTLVQSSSGTLEP
jgi:hypothetical protein